MGLDRGENALPALRSNTALNAFRVVEMASAPSAPLARTNRRVREYLLDDRVDPRLLAPTTHDDGTLSTTSTALRYLHFALAYGSFDSRTDTVLWMPMWIP